MEFTLDLSTWRSGRDGKHRNGRGETCLLNDQNFMCCLGQFSYQLGVSKLRLKHSLSPEDISGKLSKKFKYVFLTDLGFNNELTHNLITTNDSYTKRRLKVARIKKLLEKAGHTLKVVGRFTR